MNVFSRSWQITKVSFGVVGKDKEMIIYPILSAIFSGIYLLLLLFPTIITDYMVENSDGHVWEYLDILWLFLSYLGSAFIATFFNVCVVFTAKTRFEGGNATVGSSLKFAMSRLGRIFQWAFLSAVVGVILNLIQNAGKNSKSLGGQIAGRAVSGVGKAAWSITTLFVVPVLVFHDVGPGEAMKKSWATLKKTWGESIVRYIGMGLIAFLYVLLGIAIFVALGYILYTFTSLGFWAIVIPILGFVIYALVLYLVFGVATQVYNTALFIYAEKGKIPMGNSAELMKGALT